MTLIIGAETPFSRYLLAVTLPAWRPSILSFVALALLLAIGGLLAEAVLVTGGIVALVLATVATGFVWGLAALELRGML